ncbi:platelet-activating factor acetylhydrolase IB subunit gamma [Micractinium conductrix]|uniref:Platelet-activating factor acetylhydrolase IB subunit gamma n=1 Tax=Micractinium conductrix TaxID=554055 RepID=A0A2P6VIP3_9CHLO|nr:platelet-activating factor acetylhydrolase IB subunit gamma [Micractinium conductrix]|eukprot:PSC73973.1 platelet-activating factor acetylhydrolase IB subunit gamma [Micractinium conductrix]
MRWEAGQLARLAALQRYSLAFLGDAGLSSGGRRLGKRLEAAEKVLGGPVGAFGVPGDTVAALACRLAHGGLPQARVYCLQIGTNDVYMGDRAATITSQIRELAGWLRAAAPDAHVVLLSLFYLHEQQTKRQAVNESLRSFAAKAGDPRLHYSGAGELLPRELFPETACTPSRRLGSGFWSSCCL